MNRFVTKIRLVAGATFVAALFSGCLNESPVTVQVNEPHVTIASKNAKGFAHNSNSVKYRNSGVKPGTGREGSATLSVTALIAKDGSTLIEAVSGNILGATNVGNIAKTQIKVLAGDTITKNFNKLSAGGAWSTTLTPGAASGTKIQVQTNITGIDGKRTNVVTAIATAARRPDISVQTLSGAAESAPGIPMTFTALLAELNGDIGAGANCVLSVNGTVVDEATGIWIDAGGSVSCMFTHTFANEGNYTVGVSATNVNPGDWDLTNNVRTSSIEIAEEDVGDFGAGSLQAASYEYTEVRHDVSINGNPYLYNYSNRIAYSYVYMNGNLSGETVPFIDLASIAATVRVDGAIINDVTLTPTSGSAYDDGYNYSTCKAYNGLYSSSNNGDTNTYIYSGDWAQVCNYGVHGNPTSKQLSYYYQRVDGDVVYFSKQSYTNVYGESYANTWAQIGTYGTGDRWTVVAGSAVRLGLTFNGVGGESYAFDRTVIMQDNSAQIPYSYENTYEDSYYGATIHQTTNRTGTYFQGYNTWQ